MKQSIAPVVCRERDAQGRPTLKIVVGTAFFTSEHGEFVTAAHVIRAFETVRGGCPQPALYVPRGNNWQTETPKFDVRFLDFSIAQCPIVDSSLDIAVCRTQRDPAMQRAEGIAIIPVVFAPDRQPDGTSLAFSGFPLQAIQPITARGAVAAYQSSGGFPNALLVIDKNGWPGVSGAPVFLADGRVIGAVLAAGIDRGVGLSYARASSSIELLLAQARSARQ